MDTKTFIDQFDHFIKEIYRFQDSHRSMSDIKDEIHGFLDHNYKVYLHSSSKERQEIRELIKNHHTGTETPNLVVLFLIGYIQRASKKIQLTSEKPGCSVDLRSLPWKTVY